MITDLFLWPFTLFGTFFESAGTAFGAAIVGLIAAGAWADVLAWLQSFWTSISGV